MKRRNQRGVVLEGTLLLGMWVAMVFTLGGKEWAAERRAEKAATVTGTTYRIGIDYGGTTTSMCEERP